MKSLMGAGLVVIMLVSWGVAQAAEVDGSKPAVQIATAKVKPEAVAAFKTSVEKILQPTRAEVGSVSYHYVQSIDDPTEFIFIEVWKSSRAIDLHMNTPFIKKF